MPALPLPRRRFQRLYGEMRPGLSRRRSSLSARTSRPRIASARSRLRPLGACGGSIAIDRRRTSALFRRQVGHGSNRSEHLFDTLGAEGPHLHHCPACFRVAETICDLDFRALCLAGAFLCDRIGEGLEFPRLALDVRIDALCKGTMGHLERTKKRAHGIL